MGVHQGHRAGAQPGQHHQHLTGQNDDVATQPTTIVGVTRASGSIGDTAGLAGIIFLLAALNVFIGVFNMFPLLPLDGGHAAVATYERIREGRTGRRYFTDVAKLMPLTMGVVAILLFLFMSGLYLDVTEPSLTRLGHSTPRCVEPAGRRCTTQNGSPPGRASPVVDASTSVPERHESGDLGVDVVGVDVDVDPGRAVAGSLHEQHRVGVRRAPWYSG